MTFPRYPKLKDSGVEWMGEVPDHWEVGVLRRFAQMKTGHTPSRQVPEYWENCTIPWFGLADVWQLRDGTRKYLGETKESISELGLKNSAAELLPAGTVVLSRTASVGYSGIMPRPMATTQDFWNWVCGPRLNPEYLLLLFRAMVPEFERLTMGSTHKTIYQPDAAALYVCVPPPLEQSAIVEFLTRETCLIDSLVREQTVLLELLRTKREAAVIANVMRGLNSDVRLVPSGAEWLGEVPSHWKVVRLASLFHEAHDTGGEDLPILSVSIHDGVSDRELGEAEMERRVARSDDRSQYKRVSAGDLVYNMMRAWQGAFGTVAVDGLVSPAYVVARPRTDLPTAFVELLLRTPAAIEEMRRHSRGVTDFRLRLYWDAFKNIRVAIPPREEANAILEAISEVDQEHQRITHSVEQSIALLMQRRQALISAAVTGKIDIRGIAKAAAEAA